MPLALVISSHVAGSRVGAKPVETALLLARIDALVCPTTLFGRHPGHGPPGGGPVPEALLAGMLEGLEAQGLFAQLDAVFTGYMASSAQAEIAAAAIALARKARPGLFVMVDPIVGDAPGGLYVSQAVAAAQRDVLVPLADVIAPNLWELGWLTGAAPKDAGEALSCVQRLGKPALVSSIRHGGEIGALFWDGREAHLALAPAQPSAPHGTGDLLAGVFLADRIAGVPAPAALRRGVAVTADIVAKAHAWGAPELPLAGAMDSVLAASHLPRLIRLEPA